MDADLVTFCRRLLVSAQGRTVAAPREVEATVSMNLASPFSQRRLFRCATRCFCHCSWTLRGQCLAAPAATATLRLAISRSTLTMVAVTLWSSRVSQALSPLASTTSSFAPRVSCAAASSRADARGTSSTLRPLLLFGQVANSLGRYCLVRLGSLGLGAFRRLGIAMPSPSLLRLVRSATTHLVACARMRPARSLRSPLASLCWAPRGLLSWSPLLRAAHWRSLPLAFARQRGCRTTVVGCLTSFRLHAALVG